jgi:PleD family two-component response regulator
MEGERAILYRALRDKDGVPSPKRVLVVDDDESIQALADVALSNEGDEVTVPVSDGARRGVDTIQHPLRRWSRL